ncbi:MAG: DUF4366 domain-containing protein [Clostridia bacterium]|nr:DUF4366 domain-containing protein [Clostridia bacterium]
MKKFNHGGRLTSAFLLLTLVVYVMSGIVGGAAEPINANQEGQDPYDWSNYPGEVILDAPEFILGDDTDGAAEPGEISDGEQQGSGDHIPLFTDTETPGETGNDPAAQNTDAPGEQGTDQPTVPGTETTDQPDDQQSDNPHPTDLQSLFEVEIKLPSGWFNVPEKAVRVKITPKTDLLWENVKYRVDDGDWQETRKADFTLKDGYYYCDVTVTANCVLTVRLSDGEAYFDTTREIRIFDHLAPVVTAGFRERILHVEAPDDLSGAAGVQVNGLLFTTLENGMLDVQMEEVLLTYKQLAIRAYDYAGNFSAPVTLDNPYYLEPTPTPKATKKPAATQKPVVTEAPTPTPKPTKKPSGGGSGTSEKETEKPTKAPAATAAPEKQEPIVIIVTPPPTAEPAPTPTPEIEYVPLGPGQPFTQHGNMATRDVLYSASTNKQFISVQSRNGQTYYMVIDYDKPIDEANEIYETYFLNMVDDRDLISVLTDEEIVPTPTPQIIYVTPEPTTVPQPTQPPAEPQKKSDNSAVALLLLVIVLLAVVGFAVWFTMNQKKTTVPNLPEYDEDEYEMDESEEETDSGDHEE